MRFLFYIIIIFSMFYTPWAVGHFSGNHNIDTEGAGQHYAWNDVIGWINFHGNNTVEVRGSELRGWAESSMGEIVLNCETTPIGSVCGNSDFKVINVSGQLRGWAWNDNIGWISFSCNDLGVCGTAPYQTTIEPVGGESFFKGWAWNEVVGWISFHCENDHDGDGNPDTCSFNTYKVQTSAGATSDVGILESNVFDTNSANPYYNYVIWRGEKKTNSNVVIQFATSNGPAGPWNFSDLGTLNVGQKKKIIPITGGRYAKYRVIISSDNWQAESSIIDDIIINYSS